MTEPASAPYDPRADWPVITIRKPTDRERGRGFFPAPPGSTTGKSPRCPKYVVVTDNGVLTFVGIPYGGDTRAEAVYWAERVASKNDFRFDRPPGWENVVGALPARS